MNNSDETEVSRPNGPPDYSRQYSQWHDDSEEHHIEQASHYLKYIEHLKLDSETNVLDIGCGRGFFLRAAKLHRLTATGIDTSTQQVAVAKRYGFRAEAVEDSAEWLAARKEMFDAIFMFDVLEHIPVNAQISFMNAVYSALKIGGRLLVRVPNASSFFAGRYRYGDWTHCCSFTEHSLDFVIHHAGFSDIHIGEDRFSNRPIWLPTPSVGGILRSLHFGAMRLRCIAEFGRVEGSKIPLTLNIVATARRL